jgi:hypothetical protein
MKYYLNHSVYLQHEYEAHLFLTILTMVNQWLKWLRWLRKGELHIHYRDTHSDLNNISYN